MEESSLEAALSGGVGKPYGQVKAVVEAGEMLHLSGFDSQTVGELMADCLQRNLRQVEVARVVRSAKGEYKRGLRGGHLRQALWGGSVQSGNGIGVKQQGRADSRMGPGGPGSGGSSGGLGGSRPQGGGHQ